MRCPTTLNCLREGTRTDNVCTLLRKITMSVLVDTLAKTHASHTAVRHRTCAFIHAWDLYTHELPMCNASSCVRSCSAVLSADSHQAAFSLCEAPPVSMLPFSS